MTPADPSAGCRPRPKRGEGFKEVVDEGGAGEDLVGAAGVEAGEAAAFLDGEAAEVAVDEVEVVAGHFAEEAMAGGLRAVLGEAHGDEIFHGAGGADDAFDAHGAGLGEDGAQRAVDVGARIPRDPFCGRDRSG